MLQSRASAQKPEPWPTKTITPEQVWLLQREKLLAWLRLAFAIVAIVVVQFNPSRVARFPLISYASLSFFLIYSVAVLYYIGNQWTDSKKIGLVTTCLDLVWVSLIVFSTGGSATPFFVYYCFPVISASVRFGIKGGLSAAAVGIALYGFIRFYFDWQDLLGIDRFVVRSVYLVVLAYFFGFLSEFEKRQNTKLLALSKTAVEAAAIQERRRITYELHDGILQSLATIILQLESCRSRLMQSQKELSRDIEDIEDFTRDAMGQIRNFLAGKETQPLAAGTLTEKLRDELTYLHEGLGLEVILECEPENPALPHAIEREVYYVLREALTNVTRHSHASYVEIHMHQNDDTFVGWLQDNGVGFDPSNGTRHTGLGLAVMAERIKKIGGELSVKSSPGSGTRIAFTIPIGEIARQQSLTEPLNIM